MRKSRKLWVESLENRALLAGNVSVSVDGNVLTIVGDGQGNGVSDETFVGPRFTLPPSRCQVGISRIDGIPRLRAVRSESKQSPDQL